MAAALPATGRRTSVSVGPRSGPCPASRPRKVTALHPRLGGAPLPDPRHLTSYSHCLRLLELPDLLDVVHEVPAVDVLHDKVEPVLRAEVHR